MAVVVTVDGTASTSTYLTSVERTTVFQYRNKSGLSDHNKVVVGCVVGLVTPALIAVVVAIFFYYRKKHLTTDTSGQEWNEEVSVVDVDVDNANTYTNLGSSPPTRGHSAKKPNTVAVNY